MREPPDGMTPEIAADAARDAMAMVRAVSAHDDSVYIVVEAMGLDPKQALTLIRVTRWFVELTEDLGLDPLPGLAKWQAESGL